MPRFRLNRRDVLRGAGSIAIGLPWLEAMQPERKAHASPVPPTPRFIAVYQTGGTVMDPTTDPFSDQISDYWRPSGSETDFVLSPILEPLQSVREKLLIVNGVDMTSAVGEQHQAGICGLLTGAPQGSAGRYPDAPSLDQVLAPKASLGKATPSLQMAVRWGTGKSFGELHPINSLTFSADAGHAPIAPQIDPQTIFDTLFGALDPGSDTQKRIARKLSILDYVGGGYETLAPKLGSSDRQKLEEHLTHLRELEGVLDGMVGSGNTACQKPTRVDTTGYDPLAGRRGSACPPEDCLSTDEMIPTVGRFMMDMLVMALACDMTGVCALQWSDTEAGYTLPWLDLPIFGQTHTYYQGDGGYRPVECALIGRWYSEQHAYLLSRMDEVDMGGHTLLDESIVFFGSDISTPHTHSKRDMPFMLAGGGGGLRANRWLQYDGRSHNDLLSALHNLVSDEPVNTFGDPAYSDAPLTGLT